jgi:hypothetical protein
VPTSAPMRNQHLVQLLLPAFDDRGSRFDERKFKEVSAELTRKFGGTTSFLRSPAEGLWAEAGHVAKDQIIVIETMVDTFDEGWWKHYQTDLEKRFRQREIIVRALAIVTL